MSKDLTASSHMFPTAKGLKKFFNLSVTVIIPRDSQGEDLIRGIQKTRASVQHIWPMPETIPTDSDIVFCQLVDDLPSRFQGLPGNAVISLIAVIPATGKMNYTTLENSVPHAVLHMPCRPEEVLSAMTVALSNYQYEVRLRQRINKLDETLRSMKTIERAKVILMQSKNLNEEEAYRQLRRTAMERRVTIGAIASSIVDSQELIG